MNLKGLNFLKSKRSRAELLYQRGNVHNEAGRWLEAVAEYDRAIGQDPSFAKAYCNRGTALQHLGKREEALASYERAAALNPEDHLTFYNRGVLLREMQEVEAALASYGFCLALQPNHVTAWVNRGTLLQELKRHEEAVESFNQAIKLAPLLADAFHKRAYSLVQLRHFESAVLSYDKAAELNPTYKQEFQGRLYALVSMGRFEAAIATYDEVLATEPDQRYLAGLRLHAKMQICNWSEFDAEVATIVEGLLEGRSLSPPFPLLAAIDSSSLHRRCAELWVRDQCPPDAALGSINRRPRREKVRLGYFSADFRSHAVSQAIVEVIELHDRSRFEVIAFAFGPSTQDPLRSRLQKAFDRVIDISQQADLQVAELARDMGIDVAIDLGGYTEFCRTKIFAHRAAPVQVNYLGYPSTMGSPYMDYLIADKIVVPPGRQSDYSEKIIYLPSSYLPHDSHSFISDRVFARSELNLPSNAFVYCCFNKKYKITPAIFGCWMRVLASVNGSVLWLSRDNEAAERNLRALATRFGVDDERLIFADRVESLPEHLGRIRSADLFLDTTPYNAHATATDALWAGLPILTVMGDTFASRVSASLLNAAGLSELIAQTIDQYEQIAIELGCNRLRLRELRERLANNRRAMPLFDTIRYARNLEDAYSWLYARSLEGRSPDHYVVIDNRNHPAGN